MYDRILVPTDGSSTAEAAFEHAVELATRYDAEIYALYVVDTDAMSIALGPEQVDRVLNGQFEGMSEIREKAEEAIDRVAAIAEEAGVECHTEIRGGQPHRKIRDAIDDDGTSPPRYQRQPRATGQPTAPVSAVTTAIAANRPCTYNCSW